MRCVWMLLFFALGCGETQPAPEPVPPADGLPQPADLLAPELYDCRAGEVAPPERPHPATCWRDLDCDSPLVAGHRMATTFAPENSLSALRAAILLGVDIVETDVRLSADGEVVLIHDAEVDRTLSGRGAVSSFTLAELQAMGMVTELPGDFACDRVPTLPEVFAIARGAIVVELEVKDSDAGVEAARYLHDNDLYDHAFLLCGRSECEALRSEVPDAPIMTRPDAPEEVAAELAYDPVPLLVHIDAYPSFLDETAAIHAAGAKTYANAFVTADVSALGADDLSGYPPLFEALDVVQTEFPHWALMALGRL